MNEDEIRGVVGELAEADATTPPGFVRVEASVLAERMDLGAASVWIANHGGMVEPAGDGAVERAGEAFLIPQRALRFEG